MKEDAVTVAMSMVPEISGKQRRADDRGRTLMRMTFSLPFEGDAILLRCRPSTYAFSPPEAVVVGNEIRLTYDLDEDSAAEVSHRLVRDMSEINRWLSWLDVDLKSAL